MDDAAETVATEADQAEVGIGFAISKEVILGAGLTTDTQDLRFFAEAQRPSRDPSGVVNFIQYFLDTAKASIHFVVKGVHLAHAPEVADDMQPLLAALRSEGIRILSVEAAPVASRRCPASAMPPAAASWPPEVKARAQVAIGAAAIAAGVEPAAPSSASAPARAVVAATAPGGSNTAHPRAVVIARTDDSGDTDEPPIAAPAKGAVQRRTPKIRRSQAVRDAGAAIDNSASEEMREVDTVVDEPVHPDQAVAEVKKLRKRLRKRNREVAILQEQVLEKNGALAELQQELISRSELSTEGDIDHLRLRLDEMTADLERARSAAAQQRTRAGAHSMDVSRRELEVGLLLRTLAAEQESRHALGAALDEKNLELLTQKSLHTLTKDHAATIEHALGVKTRTAQQLRDELRQLHEQARNEQLQRVQHTAQFDGFVEAVRADATRAMRTVESDLEQWSAAVHDLEVSNQQLHDQLRHERHAAAMLQSEVAELRARLSDVRAQVVRTPQQTPRLRRTTTAVEDFEDTLAARLTLLRSDAQPTGFAETPDVASPQVHRAVGSGMAGKEKNNISTGW